MNSAINFTNTVAVGLGAALGAWSRWGLGIAFNAILPNLPLGTLIANLSGGLLMGVAMGLIGLGSLDHPSLRLFVTTGFLGGLTTFSAFTGESLSLLHRHEYHLATFHAFTHMFGALLMAALGVAAVQYVKH
ncbi:MAG: fluoride ion transporter CrcB [Methylotenera sp.]|jgi:CrcB protein|uniref:Fluoride-specific ion channel FluC n=1 Tax=Methylotenera mobilis TaxID=359408 RepID=A0A351RAP5_9PROT|nr:MULTISPECIES: fluoride efflux transporter CrcB [Methylotenera]HBA09116.1 fluoride ion transporter CrcB [Methylotenera mobilis]MDP3210417.1 fluoride efflux transporter CrcB [Methylotenera sp.]MDP3776759.1 fluoride efflux transporter CrcB [Methylotenera sp.]PPC96005.1 MAG: fluoride ion transporter CrcB [Methylotenera sp.]PPD48767.1 MAG: fluoride ion transporter CrcB [Methylotenera sp.]